MDVDTNFDEAPALNRQQVLQKYTNALKQLRISAERSYHVSPFYFDNYVNFQYFQQRSTNTSQTTNTTNSNSTTGNNNNPSSSDAAPTTWADMFKFELLSHFVDRRRRLLYWLFYILLAYCCVFAYRHETSIVIVERSKESLARMRLWRRISLPVIQRFPQLTELYDETCLMANPFFQIDDLSCEPCARVESVRDLSDLIGGAGGRAGGGKEFQNSGSPFIYKIKQNPIELHDIYNLYASNQEIFQRDAYRVQSTNREVSNVAELFGPLNATQHDEDAADVDSDGHVRSDTQPTFSETHNLWRCNRMLPARLLRKLFAPALPNSGIALERYVAIDTPQAPAYTLPHTECANVYVQQALGSRYIILRPTSECRHKCRTISIRLPQSVVLIYNWWYWRPISTTDPIAEQMSISLIGSYC